MATLINPIVLDEPIARAEVTHLTRTGVSHRWRTLVIVIALMLAASMLLTVTTGIIARSGIPLNNTMQDVWYALMSLLRAINLALFFLVFAIQALLTLQALMLSSDAIARERHNGTWDLLILTERGARQIIMGKWRAVRSYLFQTYKTAILLRAVVVFWLGISAFSGGVPRPTYPYSSAQGYYNGGTPAYGSQISSYSRDPDYLTLTFASAMVLAYTALDLALAAAIGLSAAVQTKRGMAFASAGAVYIGAMVLMSSSLPLIAPLRSSFSSPWYYLGRIGLALTPLDGGAVLAFRLTSMPYFYGIRWLPFIQRVAVNVALFLILIAVLLWVARRLARRQGAMHTERPESQEPRAE